MQKTKSSFQKFKQQLKYSILSCPIIYINHYHFSYVDEVLKEIMEDSSLRLTADSIVEYDRGHHCVVKFNDKTEDKEFSKYTDISVLLSVLVDPSKEEIDEWDKESKSVFANKRIYLFKDLNNNLWGQGQFVSDYAVSLMQSFATKYEEGFYDSNTTIIIVSPEPISSIPSSLLSFVTVLDLQPPTIEEIRQYVQQIGGISDTNDSRMKKDVEDMVRTLQGLQMYEVKQVLRTALLQSNNRISKKAVGVALEEKGQIVKKSGIIEVIEPNVSFSQVGGLKTLREDLEIKKDIFSNLGDAEKYKVPIPKGILIIGMPGCGKSMIAKATAELFNVSLLRLDVSRLMGKYVGESESNLRLALSTAEAAHPCVLWIDEIEKAFAGGNNSSGDNDMLVMRMMGHFLTWMQERKTPVYIVATANDVMRPEFMRKGRFDEVYFVNFPTETERAQILDVKIKKYREAKDALFDFSEIGDCKEVVKDMKGAYGGFSGSEIECVLNMVIEKRFQDYLKQKKDANDKDFKPESIKITKKDFEEAITKIKDSVMANQKSEDEDNKDFLHDKKTAIERILDMQCKYHFVDASVGKTDIEKIKKLLKN